VLLLKPSAADEYNFMQNSKTLQKKSRRMLQLSWLQFL
jgi:hypothetical protein